MSRARILVVDDHEEVGNTIERLLKCEFEILAAVGDGEAFPVHSIGIMTTARLVRVECATAHTETEVVQELLHRRRRGTKITSAGWAGARLKGSFGPSELDIKKEQINERILPFAKTYRGILRHALAGLRRLW